MNIFILNRSIYFETILKVIFRLFLLLNFEARLDSKIRNTIYTLMEIFLFSMKFETWKTRDFRPDLIINSVDLSAYE